MVNFFAVEREGELPKYFLAMRDDTCRGVVRLYNVPKHHGFARTRWRDHHNVSRALGPCAIDVVDYLALEIT